MFNFICHPGMTIEEILNDRNLTSKDLARGISKSLSYTENILCGKIKITNILANRLENFLGVPASFWLNLQKITDRDIAQKSH